MPEGQRVNAVASFDANPSCGEKTPTSSPPSCAIALRAFSRTFAASAPHAARPRASSRVAYWYVVAIPISNQIGSVLPPPPRFAALARHLPPLLRNGEESVRTNDARLNFPPSMREAHGGRRLAA